MKYIKTFEHLGIEQNIIKICEDVLKHLQQSDTYTLKTNLHGRDITVNFIYNTKQATQSGIALDSFLEYTDVKNNIYTIKIGNLRLSDIVHEFKHLDRAIRKNMKVDPTHYLNFVGRDVLTKFRFLLDTKDVGKDILIGCLYLIDPNEFESYYHGAYIDIKEMIKPNMTKDEKIKIIDDYLNNLDIYIMYQQFVNYGGFEFELYFKNKKSMYEYLDTLYIKIDQFYENLPEYDNWFKYQIKSIYNLLTKKENKYKKYDGIVKWIDMIMNKTINNGYKKFHRLYTIFLEL